MVSGEFRYDSDREAFVDDGFHDVFMISLPKKKSKYRFPCQAAEKMAQGLRTPVLAEDQALVPSSHMATINHL